MSPHRILAALIAAWPLTCAQAQTSVAPRAAQASAPAPTSRVDGATTLVLEDVLPWGFDSNEQVLASLGVAFDTVGSEAFRTVDLAPYSTIIVASVQPQSIYDALAARSEDIDQWILGAHTLEFHAADAPDDRVRFELPGHVRVAWDPQGADFRTKVDDPLTQGLPHQLNGNYASHASFERRHVVKAHVLVTTASEPKHPVMIDYCVGAGRVIATGQTVEFAWHVGWNFAAVLPNMISASTQAPGCPA
jgi:hypothetical protein